MCSPVGGLPLDRLGGLSHRRYHDPPDVGETHPQDSDFLGLAKVIPNTFDHGTRQSRYIQCFAPRAKLRHRARKLAALPAPLPNDIIGATNGILALADDDAVQVVSMSMGTIFRFFEEMERAIDELHGRGKILVGGRRPPFR